MVKRFENWPILLSQFLRSRRDIPFQWGVNDCMLFPADCVQALTGIDFAAEYRGYETEEQANALIDRHGGPIILVSKYLGPAGRNIAVAGRGDIVMTSYRALGVIDDKGTAISMVTKDGMRKLPLKAAIRVWSY